MAPALELLQHEGDDPGGISSQFYDKVLSVIATVPGDRRFRSVADLILKQVGASFTSADVDVELLVLQCLPPLDSAEASITSLYVNLAVGRSPWAVLPHSTFQLHGAESLAGYAAKRARPMVSQNTLLNSEHFPLRQDEHAKSIAAYPLLQMGCVAGCFQVQSTQLNYFSPERLDMLRRYSDLLALAFQSHEFYDPQTMALHLMPPSEVQRPYLMSFRQRVLSTLHRAASQQIALNALQAERLALQEVERELREH